MRRGSWKQTVGLAMLVGAAVAALPAATLELTNPLAVARKSEVVSVPLAGLQGIDPQGIEARIGDKTVPVQSVDSDLDGTADTLYLLVDLAPKATVTVTIQNTANPAPVARLVHAELAIKSDLPPAQGQADKIDGDRYTRLPSLKRPAASVSTHYRFEGPMIESKLVAYRFYFDARGALDIYAKTKPVFLTDAYNHTQNYHSMQDWGRDVLHNGTALGVGGLGVGLAADRFSPSGADDVEFQLVADGPIYAAYRLTCRGVEYGGKRYDLAYDVSMTAGQRYLIQSVRSLKGGPLPLVAVLTSHLEEGGVTERRALDQAGRLDWLATWGDQVYPDANPAVGGKVHEKMGMGVLWNHSALKTIEQNDREFDMVMEPTEALTYYSLAAYNLEPGTTIVNGADFYKDMDETAQRLANPITVKVR